jgi:hypothetical protein
MYCINKITAAKRSSKRGTEVPDLKALAKVGLPLFHLKAGLSLVGDLETL